MVSVIITTSSLAGMVELVDAPDSKSGASNGVRVQVPLPAPESYIKPSIMLGFFI